MEAIHIVAIQVHIYVWHVHIWTVFLCAILVYGLYIVQIADIGRRHTVSSNRKAIYIYTYIWATYMSGSYVVENHNFPHACFAFPRPHSAKQFTVILNFMASPKCLQSTTCPNLYFVASVRIPNCMVPTRKALKQTSLLGKKANDKGKA